MIYRVQDGMHTFVYWDQCVLNVAMAAREQIGAADEKFTALFRGQIAINPNYVEQCVSAWLPKPESAVEEKTAEKEPLPGSPEQPGARKVQKFLFADWDFEAIRATSSLAGRFFATRQERRREVTLTAVANSAGLTLRV